MTAYWMGVATVLVLALAALLALVLVATGNDPEDDR